MDAEKRGKDGQIGVRVGYFSRGATLRVFGRVPIFFYVLHLYLIHVLAMVMALLFGQPVRFLFHGGFFAAPSNHGHDLPFVYLMWITAVAILYFPCRWFADFKQRRKAWWLSYL